MTAGNVARRRPPTGLPTPILVSRYKPGATHENPSYDKTSNTTRAASGLVLMRQCVDYENQHCGIAFGVTSLWPTQAGAYDWTASNHDGRINTVMSGARTKVITFGLAPGWMRQVPAGVTPVDDFNPQAWLEARPQVAFFSQFAQMCADIAARYTSVTYFQVWNELKSFGVSNRWDYENYTTMYNLVWAAVKAVRPDAKIGGPYTVSDAFDGVSGASDPSTVTGPWGVLDQRILDVWTYWLTNKTGADFLCIDGGNTVRRTSDNVIVTNDINGFGKFGAFYRWLRLLDPTTYPGCRTLPLWISEFYAMSPAPSTDSAAMQVATWAVGMMDPILAGYDVVMLWKPQGNQGSTTGVAFPYGYTIDPDVATVGGNATVLQPVAKQFRDYFPAGRPVYQPDPGNANIAALATDQVVMLVNKTSSSQSTSGTQVPSNTLSAWEVKVVAWTPVVVNTLLLDAVSVTAAGAYGLRKLRAAYAGSAVRVRRSSDSTEQDIGFTASGALDTTALLAFAGAGSAYIRTWYDQTTNARNAGQAATANQPRIVNAGVVDTRNGLPAVVFDGTNDYLDAVTSLTGTAATFNVVAAMAAATAAYSRIVCAATTTGTNDENNVASASAIIRNVSTNTLVAVRNGSFLSNHLVGYSQLCVMTAVFDGTNHTMRVDRNASAGSASTGTFNSAVLRIGQGTGSNDNPLNGWVSEAVVWPSALSAANLTAAESNQKTFYGLA